LSRSDVACVGPVTATDTLKVLPFGKSRRQKVVVGDNFGHVTCLQSKRGEATVVFKTAASGASGASSGGGAANDADLPVTALVLDNDECVLCVVVCLGLFSYLVLLARSS